MGKTIDNRTAPLAAVAQVRAQLRRRTETVAALSISLRSLDAAYAVALADKVQALELARSQAATIAELSATVSAAISAANLFAVTARVSL